MKVTGAFDRSNFKRCVTAVFYPVKLKLGCGVHEHGHVQNAFDAFGMYIIRAFLDSAKTSLLAFSQGLFSDIFHVCMMISI